jgi:HPt (histidine-containing phosphotransfer) domain-containing protein
MTANTMKGDRERCLAAGMDDYVGKPVRPDALDDVIARALRLGEGQVSVGESAPGDIQSALGQDAHALLDRSVLADVWEGDEQGLGDLVALFLDQSRTMTAQLAQALGAGDADMAQRIAHGLNGSSATVGAVRLAEIASRLCDAARTGRLSDAAQLHLELQHSLDATSAAFGFELPLGLSPPTIPDSQVLKH